MSANNLLNVTQLIKQRRLRHERQVRSLSQRLSRAAFYTLGILSTALAIMALGAPAALAYVTRDLPSVDILPQLLNSDDGALLTSTQIYDRNGEWIASLAPASFETRSYVELQDNPLLAVAFSQFLDPLGLDPVGNSSEMAERLVRHLLVSQEAEGRLKNLRSELLSAQVLQAFGNEQIMEWVLNSSHFGNRIYGVGNAARYYLGKSVAQANLSDLTLLAIIADTTSIEDLQQRQQFLLVELLDKGLITEDEAKQALVADVHINAVQYPKVEVHPHFTDLVLEQLYLHFDEESIWRGGFEVTSTLDLNLQNEVAELADGIKNEIVVMDSRSAEILTFLGPANEARPAPGALLSPFVYLNAFANGLAPASLIWDIPSNLVSDLPDYHNADGIFHGPITLRQALANKYLVPAVDLLSEIDAASTWQIAEKAGLSSLANLSPDDEAALLTQEATLNLLEFTHSISTIANHGQVTGQLQGEDIAPITILSVRDPLGQEHSNPFKNNSRSIISSELTFLLTDVLSDTSIPLGNEKSSLFSLLNRPTALHMASANEGDKWIIGYSPQLVIGLRATENSSSEDISSQLWVDIFGSGHQGLPIQSWITPATLSSITVCVPSGLLPSEDCPQTRRELFLPGFEPTQVDNFYQRQYINRNNGKLATVFTPLEMIMEKVFVNIPDEAEVWALQNDFSISPTEYDSIPASAELESFEYQVSPAMHTFIRGQLNVEASLSLEEDNSYRILLGEGLYPKAWLEIGRGEIPDDGKVASSWDVSDLEGTYVFQLQILSSDTAIRDIFRLVMIDNKAPELEISSPTSGQVLRMAENPNLLLSAQIKDNLDLREVAYYLDGSLIASQIRAPYQLTWPASLGDHRLRVRAVDQAGNQIEEEVSFTVIP